MPPEVISFSNTNADPAIDVWAMGIILYFLLFACLPFRGNSDKEIAKMITTQKVTFPIDKRKISAECKKLLLGLLNKRPKERLKICEILQSDWMKVPYAHKTNTVGRKSCRSLMKSKTRPRRKLRRT
jgi:serine/threonine protein kinase